MINMAFRNKNKSKNNNSNEKNIEKDYELDKDGFIKLSLDGEPTEQKEVVKEKTFLNEKKTDLKKTHLKKTNSKKTNKKHDFNEAVLKAAVISQGSTSSQWTIEAMKKYFDQVDDINLKKVEINFSGINAEVLYGGKPLANYDCLYIKGSFRYAPLLAGLTTLLSKNSFLPIRADAFTIAHDKLLTQLALQQRNIPMPRTYQAATSEAAKRIMKKMNFPIVMKFPHGTQGKGVVVSDSYSSASSVLDAFDAINQPFIIQEFVETGGEDIRAIVVGDEVVASMKRIATSEEKRANIHAGGKGLPVTLDENTKAMAVKVAKTIGAEICGVDLLVGVKGAVCIEGNVSPGLQGVTSATKVDVADKIAKHLYQRTLSFINIKNELGHQKMLEDVKMENGDINMFIAPLDFKGSKIVLPEVITKVTCFKPGEDFEISIEKDFLEIKKFKM